MLTKPSTRTSLCSRFIDIRHPECEHSQHRVRCVDYNFYIGQRCHHLSHHLSVVCWERRNRLLTRIRSAEELSTGRIPDHRRHPDSPNSCTMRRLATGPYFPEPSTRVSRQTSIKTCLLAPMTIVSSHAIGKRPEQGLLDHG